MAAVIYLESIVPADELADVYGNPASKGSAKHVAAGNAVAC